MESAKYQLTRESASYGIEPTALVYLADLMMAIELVMTTASGLAKEHVTKWIKLLRLSVPAICASLGDDITPEKLLIQDLIDSRADIRDKLRKTHTSAEATRHSNHLRLLFAYARGMGVKHVLFDVQQDWEQLPFYGQDRAAQMVITFLIDSLVHRHEVTKEHFEDFRASRREDYSIPATNQAIAYLKMRIREMPEPEAEFPLLDVSSERPDACPFRLALKNMDPCLKTDVEGAMAWLAEEVAPGIKRMSESTRKHFLMLLEILCGFANWLPHVGMIAGLSDCLNRPVITVYARWLYQTKRANQATIKTRIHSLHAFLTTYPPFANQDWSWMSTKFFSGQQTAAASALLAEFPKEPESKIDARREDRAFDYDYSAIDHLPQLMHERRESFSSRSEVEIARMLHDECLMGWLGYYPLPPRCMYECRIKGDSPNLFRPSEYPDRVPESLARTKNLHLVSEDMWVILFVADEVPNRSPIDGPLPDQLVSRLLQYLRYRHLLIKGKDPGTLFLNRDGGTLKASTFSKLVGNISESYLGKPIPPSAFRDIAAYRFLSWRPGDYSTLASLLCQSEHSVRMRYDRDYRLAHRSKRYHGGHAA
jgi:hypothetical protein